MRITVVGLLADQANEVRASFPNHDLNFLSRDRERELPAHVRRSDKVVLMTKFISHQSQAQVPPKKRALIPGGVTALCNFLQQQPSAPKLIPNRVLDTPEAATNEEQDMAKGKHQPPKSKQLDWTKFKECKAGDVLKFHRPPWLSQANWENKVAAIRSYYSRFQGVVTAPAEFDGPVTTIFVKEIKPVKKAPKKTAVEEPVQAAPAEAPVQVAPAEEHTVTLSAGAPSSSITDREFWSQVFLLNMQQQPGRDAYFHAQAANAAVEALRAKLG